MGLRSWLWAKRLRTHPKSCYIRIVIPIPGLRRSWSQIVKIDTFSDIGTITIPERMREWLKKIVSNRI